MTIAIVAVALVALVAACSGDGGACPNEEPASCPSPMPSYASDVAPILGRYCVTCHSPTGVDPAKPLDTYDHVFARRTGVLSQLTACMMPPPGEDAPSDAERATVLGWIVCGAPNN